MISELSVVHFVTQCKGFHRRFAAFPEGKVLVEKLVQIKICAADKMFSYTPACLIRSYLFNNLFHLGSAARIRGSRLRIRKKGAD